MPADWCHLRVSMATMTTAPDKSSQVGLTCQHANPYLAVVAAGPEITIRSVGPRRAGGATTPGPGR